MKNFTCIMIIFIFFSCSTNKIDSNEKTSDLEPLTEDTGGYQVENILGSTDAVYGHYIYTPSDYNKNSNTTYPLLVFLHGGGQIGNSETNPDALKVLLNTGPPKLINKKEWAPKYPMIVASPQSTGRWEPKKIHDFISYLIINYNININRIYLTGYSMGGNGCFNYISEYGADAYATAIVPIAGGGNPNTGNKFNTISVWAFHGDNDTTVSHTKSINMINAINFANPKVKAKLTIYPGVAHNSDTRTFDNSGMGTESNNYDAFNMTIYDWMLLYKKDN